MRSTASALALSSLIAVAGCVGILGGDPDDDDAAASDGGPDGADGDGEVPTEEALSEIGDSGARRLTAAEYDATIRDLLGIEDASSALLLPEDRRTPYDNDYTEQRASEALIAGAELLAGDLATAVTSDPALVADLLPCTPSGPTDAACFEDFLRTFGRRALRRPIADDEVARWSVLLDHAEQAGDFAVAVDSALRLFLQHPELLYRVEIGTPVDGQPGVFRLSPFEIATRIAYLTWGSTPPDWLLDAAETGGLDGDAAIREAAATLLDDDRARARIARFHALWLGYEQLPHGADLAAAMQAESRALIERVVFEERGPWADLLRAEQTFVGPLLTDHYGLPYSGEKETWVDYPEEEGAAQRRGLLSHGAFLSAFAKFDDTSPTQRGILIRTRLFCQTIDPPPPGVNVDAPPVAADPDACKEERYAQHAEAGCAGCHDLLDKVGFGLESFDEAGLYREHDDGRPECTIEGRGELVGVGSFSGPAELATLMIQDENLDACIVTQLYRFAIGRYQLDDPDEELIGRLVDEATASGELHFDRVLLDLVSTPAFRFRRESAADGE